MACYRTGLDITQPIETDVVLQYQAAYRVVSEGGSLRLAYKALNDFIVRLALNAAGNYGRPGAFLLIRHPSICLRIHQFNSTQDSETSESQLSPFSLVAYNAALE